MEVGTKVVAENIQQRTERHTNTFYFTLVAWADGKAVPVPPLSLDSDIHRKRFREAEIRKQMRLGAEQRMQQATVS